MFKPDRWLTLAGSLFIIVGALVILAAIFAPQTVPPITVTLDLRDIMTPTPAFLSTPLPPPGQSSVRSVAIVLPVMPGERPAAVLHTAAPVSPSPPPTATQTTPAVTAATPVSPPPAPERIVIPVLGVDAPILPVSWHTLELSGQPFGQWDVPDGYAVGWHNESARLGMPGNIVLNGHHNVEGKVFGGLIRLQPGDVLTLYGGGEVFHYTVVQMMVLQEQGLSLQVRLDNARWIQPGDDERVTLVTCWPRTGNSHRLIVVALPADRVPTAVLSGPGGEPLGRP